MAEPEKENKGAALPHDANGFVQMPPSPGAEPNTVYVVAGEGCAKAESQRADKLHSEEQSDPRRSDGRVSAAEIKPIRH